MSKAYASASTSPHHYVVEFCRDVACLTWRAYAETFRYIYVYIYIYIYIYIYVYICMYIYIYIYIHTYRNWSALSIRFVSVLFFAAILSLIYSDLGYNQKNIQDRIGILYFVLTNQVFYIYIYVYTYIYMCIYICIYIYIYVCKHMYVYIYIHSIKYLNLILFNHKKFL
jgi:hypothetical protein